MPKLAVAPLFEYKIINLLTSSEINFQRTASQPNYTVQKLTTFSASAILQKSSDIKC